MSKECTTAARTVKPIAPHEVSDEKIKQIPPEVIESFNFLIARDYMPGSRSAIVIQNAAIREIMQRTNLSRDEIFSQKFLDVEDIYRKEGWIVDYDKPAYNESYGAYFIFRKGPR